MTIKEFDIQIALGTLEYLCTKFESNVESNVEIPAVSTGCFTKRVEGKFVYTYTLDINGMVFNSKEHLWVIPFAQASIMDEPGRYKDYYIRVLRKTLIKEGILTDD